MEPRQLLQLPNFLIFKRRVVDSMPRESGGNEFLRRAAQAQFSSLVFDLYFQCGGLGVQLKERGKNVHFKM